MTRDIICTINNQTSGSINWDGVQTSNTLEHGKTHYGPVTINSGKSDEAFKIQKTTASAYGVTGYIRYNLPDDNYLYLMFNNPYTHSGSGNTGNQWFYAVIQPKEAGGYSNYYATVSGAGINPVSPEGDDTLTVTVNVYDQMTTTPSVDPNVTSDPNDCTQLLLYIDNQLGTGVATLAGMTNKSSKTGQIGVGSPPIKSGNPPMMTETLPNGQKTLAMQANGGRYISYQSPEPPYQTDYGYPATEGELCYVFPNGETFILSWNIEYGTSSPSVQVGGTYQNPPTPTRTQSGNSWTYTYTFNS